LGKINAKVRHVRRTLKYVQILSIILPEVIVVGSIPRKIPYQGNSFGVGDANDFRQIGSSWKKCVAVVDGVNQQPHDINVHAPVQIYANVHIHSHDPHVTT